MLRGGNAPAGTQLDYQFLAWETGGRSTARSWKDAIVMVTHDAAVAASADRLVQLRDGLVVNDGPSSSAAVPPRRQFQEELTR